MNVVSLPHISCLVLYLHLCPVALREKHMAYKIVGRGVAFQEIRGSSLRLMASNLMTIDREELSISIKGLHIVMYGASCRPSINICMFLDVQLEHYWIVQRDFSHIHPYLTSPSQLGCQLLQGCISRLANIIILIII